MPGEGEEGGEMCIHRDNGMQTHIMIHTVTYRTQEAAGRRSGGTCKAATSPPWMTAGTLRGGEQGREGGNEGQQHRVDESLR